ncbi:ABC transporter substrate-binding protein [Halorussus salinisoli]|uniref:ABC transporter substrate-binding protein n=1 Tax=Halorussus salinisoli TaxID=2558242 RepID=UPI0010C15E42|nr:ABC transporter substrate-binding protein [Halorussus salinisoli]
MSNDTNRGAANGVTRVRRRTLLRAAGAVGLAGSIAGYAGDASAARQEGELELVHWWTAGGEQEALQALIEGFQEQNPDIEVVNNPAPGGAGSALDTVIKNRILNQDPPSTFQIWPGQSLNEFIEGDVLRDIGDSVWTDEMREAYLDDVQELARPQGNFVSVPLNIHRLNNLFFNTQVLEDAGVDLSNVDSPSALLEAMETVDSETDAVPMAQQTQSPWSTLQLWEDVLVGEAGVDVYRDVLDGNVGDHEDAVRSSLDLVTQYKDLFNQDAGSITWDQANAKVIQGDAAMIHQGDWAAGQYKATEDFEFESDWDAVPFPGTTGIYHIVSDSFTFPKPNPSPDATTKWLQWVGSVEGQETFNPIKGSIPPRTDVPTDDFGPFLTRQFEDFSGSDSQPPTIAHGTGVVPEVKSNIDGVFASFIENWNVDRAFNGLSNAFDVQ